MLNLSGELTAAQRIVPSIDTSDLSRARDLTDLSVGAGAVIVKLGLEVMSAPSEQLGSSPEECAAIAQAAGADWIADAKLNDIPNTTQRTVANYAALDHPPSGITIHAQSGVDSMRAAQEVASEAGITMLGVTELTTTTPEQLTKQLDHILERLGIDVDTDVLEKLGVDAIRKAVVYARLKDGVEAGIGGFVASGQELIDPIGTMPELQGKVTMIPGTRLAGTDAHDQKMVVTPHEAMYRGATLLVHGRAITQSDDPVASFRAIEADMQAGLDARSAA